MFISSVVDKALELDTGMDPLTKLFNRRYLDTILRRETEISMMQKITFSVILFDLDHFKEINDKYGHEAGDMVLKQFSELLLLSVRVSDFIFRFGGEEFLLILGNVEKKEAYKKSETIRTLCEKHPFKISADASIHVTCSAGVAEHNGHPDFNRILNRADGALYQAKNHGRNRTAIAD